MQNIIISYNIYIILYLEISVLISNEIRLIKYTDYGEAHDSPPKSIGRYDFFFSEKIRLYCKGVLSYTPLKVGLGILSDYGFSQ